MAIAKKCDRCGRFFEGNVSYKYNDGENEFIVNSFRVGNWDQKKKIWRSIASGYDLCETCGREITDCIMAGENNQIKMRMVQTKATRDARPGKVVASADPIEGEEPQPEVQEATDVTE